MTQDQRFFGRKFSPAGAAIKNQGLLQVGGEGKTLRQGFGGADMKIACLGWGSLVWDPQDLPLRSDWFPDGPLLRVEFVRQSSGGRITLVLLPTAAAVRSLWAEVDTDDPDIAKELLRQREGRPVRQHIGIWLVDEPEPNSLPGLSEWALERDVDAVIWTDLPPKFQLEEGRIPHVEEVVAYLNGLEDPNRADAIEYIRRAPPQIDTVYRREIARLIPETSAA